mmetsp:Transcript_36838/g.105583  ORF Transcript_36838/g.105583 Transcript_36838/m.105583 type:complete len:218 (-) Transcript_36838:412-1065(-)
MWLCLWLTGGSTSRAHSSPTPPYHSSATTPSQRGSSVSRMRTLRFTATDRRPSRRPGGPRQWGSFWAPWGGRGVWAYWSSCRGCSSPKSCPTLCCSCRRCCPTASGTCTNTSMPSYRWRVRVCRWIGVSSTANRSSRHTRPSWLSDTNTTAPCIRWISMPRTAVRGPTTALEAPGWAVWPGRSPTQRPSFASEWPSGNRGRGNGGWGLKLKTRRVKI